MYDHRPVECRTLKCWDTGDIEKIYAENRLTRKDLVSSVEGLWELVESHQARCSYDMLTRYVDALKKSSREKPLKGILDLIEYDINIRELVVQKAGLDPELTDFLFGRPITETLRIYGIKIKKEEGKYILIPMR